MCEPLLFDQCEKKLDEAEKIYDKNEALFTDFDRIRFQIKKSSFLKKFGFFLDALEILAELEKQIMDILKSPKASGDSLAAKKLLFKVQRDKARLYALKRDETNAHAAHKKAERILNEEIIPQYTNRRSLN